MNICTNLGQANKTMKRTVDNLAPNIDSYELKDKGVYITNERKASAFTELSSGGDKRLLKVYNLSFRYSGGKLYFDNISNKIHKSYKSDKSGSIASRGIAFSGKISAPKAQAKSLQEHNEELAREAISEQTPNRKPRFVQQMMELLNKYFPEMMKNFHLTKTIARNFVAMLKYKLHWRIEEWERYLKLIATSSYLNGEKFKLTIYWILKFLTIDRILNGEFGVNPNNITYTEKEKEKMTKDRKQQIQQKIVKINESETCKQARVKVLDILGIGDYQQYFENPNKCRFIERNGEIVIEILGSEPWDFIYKEQKLEKIDTDSVRIKIEWISDCVEVVQENGYKTFYIAKSFDELEKRVQNKPLWKRIFQASELEDTVLETQADCISNTCISDTPENFGFNIAY